MSDKEVSNENEKSKKAALKIKNSALLYIIVPVVFVAVLLVFLIPAAIAADKTADRYISKLETEFAIGSNGVFTVDDDRMCPIIQKAAM